MQFIKVTPDKNVKDSEYCQIVHVVVVPEKYRVFAPIPALQLGFFGCRRRPLARRCLEILSQLSTWSLMPLTIRGETVIRKIRVFWDIHEFRQVLIYGCEIGTLNIAAKSFMIRCTNKESERIKRRIQV
jgi:hypothetical protein